MPPTTIQTAVFDLGKVLLHFDYSKAANRLAQHASSSAEEIQSLIDQSQLLSHYETGDLTRIEFFEEFKRETEFTADIQTFASVFGDIFTPIDPMIEIHSLIRQASIPTFIFSNTNDLAIEHIQATYPFFKEFTGYVYSYEEKSMKPSPDIYETVEKKTGCKGNEILYIDDRAENITTGRKRNWVTIHHTSAEESSQRIQSLLGLSPT